MRSAPASASVVRRSGAQRPPCFDWSRRSPTSASTYPVEAGLQEGKGSRSSKRTCAASARRARRPRRGRAARPAPAPGGGSRRDRGSGAGRPAPLGGHERQQNLLFGAKVALAVADEEREEARRPRPGRRSRAARRRRNACSRATWWSRDRGRSAAARRTLRRWRPTARPASVIPRGAARGPYRAPSGVPARATPIRHPAVSGSRGYEGGEPRLGVQPLEQTAESCRGAACTPRAGSRAPPPGMGSCRGRSAGDAGVARARRAARSPGRRARRAARRRRRAGRSGRRELAPDLAAGLLQALEVAGGSPTARASQRPMCEVRLGRAPAGPRLGRLGPHVQRRPAGARTVPALDQASAGQARAARSRMLL